MTPILEIDDYELLFNGWEYTFRINNLYLHQDGEFHPYTHYHPLYDTLEEILTAFKKHLKQ
jgi:hypothetical protein